MNQTVKKYAVVEYRTNVNRIAILVGYDVDDND